MIHWLFLIYWICKYAYTGEFKNRSENKEIHRHLCNCGVMWTPYRRIGGYDDE